jgi:hypothetical protein
MIPLAFIEGGEPMEASSHRDSLGDYPNITNRMDEPSDRREEAKSHGLPTLPDPEVAVGMVVAKEGEFSRVSSSTSLLQRGVEATPTPPHHHKRIRIDSILDLGLEPRATVEARFWPKVEKTSTCWNWMATRNRKGYGFLWLGARSHRAHRIAFELSKGRIQSGLQIDHLCRNHACVNPEHMEAVTNRTNSLRGCRAKQTHCKWGHLLAGDNLDRYALSRGHKRCKTCMHRWAEEYRQRVKLLKMGGAYIEGPHNPPSSASQSKRRSPK